MNWVTTEVAAETVGYTQGTIRKFCRDGFVESRIVKDRGTRGRSKYLLIRLDDLLRFVAKRSSPTRKSLPTPESLGHKMKRFPDKRVRCVICMEMLTNIQTERIKCNVRG